jgi:hypothetical protein
MVGKTEKEIVMSTKLTGDQKLSLAGKIAELQRQVFLQAEYGFDPEKLDEHLQCAIEGRWASRAWTTKDGVIYFTLVSNGRTGEEWIAHLEAKSLPVGDYAKSVLRHPDFKPTKAGIVHHIAVLKGGLFSDNDRITKNICAEAKKRKMTDPHAEVACLIRDMLSDKEIKEMGLDWIITMHEPIPDSDGYPDVLGTNRYVDGRLGACDARPSRRWFRADGFAFAVAQGARN